MRFATRMALIGVSLVFLTLIDLPFSVSLKAGFESVGSRRRVPYGAA